MIFKGIYKTGDSWKLEVQAGRTVHSLTLDEAWKLALEIVQAVERHYSARIAAMNKYSSRRHNRGGDDEAK